MRRLALAAAVVLTLSPPTAGAAFAQTAVQTTPAPAGRGLTPAEVGTWITGLGGRVGPVQSENGLTFFTVTNAGLTWAVWGSLCCLGLVPRDWITLDQVLASAQRPSVSES